jgi:hypothetical protein
MIFSFHAQPDIQSPAQLRGRGWGQGVGVKSSFPVMTLPLIIGVPAAKRDIPPPERPTELLEIMLSNICAVEVREC